MPRKALCFLPDRLMVGHRPLEASILVRIQVRQHQSAQYRGKTGERCFKPKLTHQSWTPKTHTYTGNRTKYE